MRIGFQGLMVLLVFILLFVLTDNPITAFLSSLVAVIASITDVWL